MKQRLAGIMVALAIMLGGGVAVAGPAAAADCRSIVFIKICGRVANSSKSDASIQVGRGWPVQSQRTLIPGKKSTKYYADTDALRVRKGCYFRLNSAYHRYQGGKWYKIKDLPGWRTAQVYC